MWSRTCVCALFATTMLIAGVEQSSNSQSLQPGDLGQLSSKKFQDLLSKGLSDENNALKELRGAVSSQTVCSIPLPERNVSNPGKFDKQTMRITPRTFDRIVGPTPAPACKPH